MSKPRIVNQARQRDDEWFLQTMVLPPGGSDVMRLGPSLALCERYTVGYAAVAASFTGGFGTPFSVTVTQSPGPGMLLPQLVQNSSPDPVTGLERVDFTKPVTGKFMSMVVTNLGLAPQLIICDARLRPVSCYDMDVNVVFDPGDLLNVLCKNKLGATTTLYNGNSGGANTAMFAANANRLEVVGVNLGPRPIHVAFGVPAVFGAGQYIRAGGDFRFDRTSLALNFIDDGGSGGAVVSATEFATP